MSVEKASLEGNVSEIVVRTGELGQLSAQQDYYDAGLTSLAALNLLLELEETFGVSIPDDKFIACRNVESLTAMIEGLQR